MHDKRLENRLNRCLQGINIQKLALSAYKLLHISIERHAFFVRIKVAPSAFYQWLFGRNIIITNAEYVIHSFISKVIVIANLIALSFDFKSIVRCIKYRELLV